MIAVTTSTGRKVNLARNRSNIEATIDGVGPDGKAVFIVNRTDNGLKSQGLVHAFGNIGVTIILTGADLAAAHAMFDDLLADVRAWHDNQAEYQARHDRIIKSMEG